MPNGGDENAGSTGFMEFVGTQNVEAVAQLLAADTVEGGDISCAA